jgi:hypothetical protein
VCCASLQVSNKDSAAVSNRALLTVRRVGRVQQALAGGSPPPADIGDADLTTPGATAAVSHRHCDSCTMQALSICCSTCRTLGARGAVSIYIRFASEALASRKGCAALLLICTVAFVGFNIVACVLGCICPSTFTQYLAWRTRLPPAGLCTEEADGSRPALLAAAGAPKPLQHLGQEKHGASQPGSQDRQQPALLYAACRQAS